MKYKILIVDDEPANLRALERLFRDEHEVLAATSAVEALAALENHDVALLISDQRMPEMSGLELLARTVSLRPHMVRILLTGYTDVTSLIEAINSGHVYKYVTKPWNNDELVITVSRALAHYEAMKSRHNLQMVNERLWARLNEIAELATSDDEVLPGSRMNSLTRERELGAVSVS
jgi:DNA-binding NtrC family response regulator